MSELNGWENFYVIVGSSAGALIGLQFVVITLIAGRPAARGDEQAGKAFTTPSVVHFGVVLLLSALLSAPWGGIKMVALLWGVVGLLGMIYSVIVVRRLRAQTVYQPVFEDWLFYALLPFASYALLAGAALAGPFHSQIAMFIVGAAALLLLFIGIHNAWDTVTHIVFVQQQGNGEDEQDHSC